MRHRRRTAAAARTERSGRRTDAAHSLLADPRGVRCHPVDRGGGASCRIHRNPFPFDSETLHVQGGSTTPASHPRGTWAIPGAIPGE